MTENEHRIGSIEELQRRVPSIVKAINADNELALRAAANPVLAMEELGYTFTDELRPILERRIRFSVETSQQLESLANQIYEIAGRRFNIDSSAELAHLLFDEMELTRPQQSLRDQYSTSQLPSTIEDLPTAPLPPQVGWGTKVKDPLEELRDKHSIMELILPYRQLEASEPRLAPPELYERIKNGEMKLPATSIKARLQRGPTPE